MIRFFATRLLASHEVKFNPTQFDLDISSTHRPNLAGKWIQTVQTVRSGTHPIRAVRFTQLPGTRTAHDQRPCSTAVNRRPTLAREKTRVRRIWFPLFCLLFPISNKGNPVPRKTPAPEKSRSKSKTLPLLLLLLLLLLLSALFMARTKLFFGLLTFITFGMIIGSFFSFFCWSNWSNLDLFLESLLLASFFGWFLWIGHCSRANVVLVWWELFD